MTPSFTKILLLSLFVFSPTSNTIADEKAKTEEAVKTNANTKTASDLKQIDNWVKQLGHQRLTKRVQAKKKLLSAGKTAIPSLAKAALSDKREAIERSIDVLGTLAQSKEEETADAAQVTLKMLTESNQPSTAERAKSVPVSYTHLTLPTIYSV